MTIQETLKQPSTILGIAGIVGTAAATIAHVLTHDMALAVGVATVAGSIVHVLMPDNSGAQSSVEKLVTDAVTAVATKKLAAAIPLLVSDAMGVVATLTPAPVVVAPVVPAPAAPVAAAA